MGLAAFLPDWDPDTTFLFFVVAVFSRTGPGLSGSQRSYGGLYQAQDTGLSKYLRDGETMEKLFPNKLDHKMRLDLSKLENACCEYQKYVKKTLSSNIASRTTGSASTKPSMRGKRVAKNPSSTPSRSRATVALRRCVCDLA